jgi:hypothetical protein
MAMARALVIVVALGFGAAIGAVPRPARASMPYPGLIQTQLALNYTPDCTICHRDDNGGIGTVVQPFGRALMMLGLRAEDPASLTSALEEAEAEGLDSGGDGVPDIEELKADMSPNAGGGGRPAPQYGCEAARSTPPAEQGRGGGAATLVVLTAAAAWSRRRLRRIFPYKRSSLEWNTPTTERPNLGPS